MDVLKPEVYWIGERCYRRNPCRNAERNFNFKEMGKNSSNNNGRGRSNNDLENEEDMTFLMNPSSSSSNSRNQGNLAPYVEEDTILCNYYDIYVNCYYYYYRMKGNAQFKDIVNFN
jgi:hypothetical protein